MTCGRELFLFGNGPVVLFHLDRQLYPCGCGWLTFIEGQEEVPIGRKGDTSYVLPVFKCQRPRLVATTSVPSLVHL